MNILLVESSTTKLLEILNVSESVFETFRVQELHDWRFPRYSLLAIIASLHICRLPGKSQQEAAVYLLPATIFIAPPQVTRRPLESEDGQQAGTVRMCCATQTVYIPIADVEGP